jgi:molybdopterin molybdotransferase
LRQVIHAERDNPPFDRVCMDGIAIASASVAAGMRRFRVQAVQAAGEPPLALQDVDGAIEAMTGAVLPLGADSVVPLEEYDLADGVLTLKPGATAAAWRNVQRRGSDSRPGVPMLHAGTRLGSAEVAVVASAGLAEVLVTRQPRITIVSTGDELVEPGTPIADHQVRRSNAYAAAAALRLHGFEDVDLSHLADDRAQVQSGIGSLLLNRDVLVMSGGISKGKFDYVPSALAALGVTEVFQEVAQRPGRPMWFGMGGSGQIVFGLPGNPVATLLCLIRFVLPALRAATGQVAAGIERFALSEPLPGRKVTYFMPAALSTDGTSTTGAQARPTQGSGDFLALAGTHGFIELPPQPAGYPAGYAADFYRW